jgi:cytidine deaminase
MARKSYTFTYEKYAHPDELKEVDRRMLDASRAARKTAYAPYSNFRVGAAVLLPGDIIISGSNQENASYPLCLCAERTALASSESQYPGLAPLGMAISVDYAEKQPDYPVPPCGACRQVIRETEFRYQQAIRIIIQGNSGPILVFPSASGLLPFSFEPDMLLPFEQNKNAK